MKQTCIRALLVALTLICMAVIFGFSAQTGQESGSLSSRISRPIADFLISRMENCTDAQARALYSRVDGCIRTAAHFSEYALLGLLLCLTLRRFGITAGWLPWIIGTAYAVTDEWHQSYTPQRACDVKDVLVDSLGVLCGVAFVCIIMYVWRKKHVHHQ